MGGGESKTCTKAQSDLQVCNASLSMSRTMESACMGYLYNTQQEAISFEARLGQAYSDLQGCTANLDTAQTAKIEAQRDLQACNFNLDQARSNALLLSTDYENLLVSSGKVQSDLDDCRISSIKVQSDLSACVTNGEKSSNMFYARYNLQSGQPIPDLCRTVFKTEPAPEETALYGPICVSDAYLDPDKRLDMSSNPVCHNMQPDGFTYFPCTGPKPDESTIQENASSYPGLSVL